MVMAKNIDMMTDDQGSGRRNMTTKKKATTTRKTVATPGTKVSQATIDKIKAMGMTKALKSAGSASPEMREGLKRLYGAKRVAAAAPSKPAARSADAARSGAMKPSKPAAKSADAARAGAMKPSKPVAKSADAARMTALQKSRGQNMPYKTPGAKPVKKSGTTDPFARFVFGVGKAAKEPFTSKAKKTK
jgi:hypothetical protein